MSSPVVAMHYLGSSLTFRDVPKPYIAWLAILAACLTLACDGVSRFSSSHTERDEWIAEQRDRLVNGEDNVLLYGCEDTDGILCALSGMPELKKLEIEQTDITETGLAILKTFPNLRHLSLVGPNSVDDSTFHHIAECRKLQSLVLNCTKVTDVGLESILTLPNLQYLELLPHDHFTGITDAAVATLVHMDTLKTLSHSGWASDEAIEDLKTHLPKCRVTRYGR